MPGRAGLTPHTLWLSQARGKRKMRGFNGEERQERKEVRLGSEGKTQVGRESRADGPCCRGSRAGSVLCSGPAATSSSAHTSYWARLSHCCATSGQPLTLSGHSSTLPFSPTLPASEACRKET